MKVLLAIGMGVVFGRGGRGLLLLSWLCGVMINATLRFRGIRRMVVCAAI
jgi:hypothetical protein